MYITHSPSSVETKWQDLREGIFKAMSRDIPTKFQVTDLIFLGCLQNLRSV